MLKVTTRCNPSVLFAVKVDFDYQGHRIHLLMPDGDFQQVGFQHVIEIVPATPQENAAHR